MAPQRTVVDHRALDSELRKPLFAMSCAACRKIRQSRRAPFTQSAWSATINHNNLDTCESPALILGTQRGGFKSEFLLRARRGSEAGRRGGTTCLSRAPRSHAIHSLCSTRSFVLHQANADIGRHYTGCWQHTSEEGKNERQSRSNGARSNGARSNGARSDRAGNAGGRQRSRLEDDMDSQPPPLPQLDRSRPRGCSTRFRGICLRHSANR